jgi:hypothetical protein
MSEIPKSREKIEKESVFDESLIQDLGVIALESLRYPHAKQHFIKVRNTPPQYPRSSMEIVNKNLLDSEE